MKLSKAKRQQFRKKAEEHPSPEFILSVDEMLGVIEELEEVQYELKSKLKLEKLIMAALQNLTTSIAALTTAVDAAVAVLTAPPVTGVPEADVQAAADAVTAQTTRLVAATPVPTPPPPPPPAPTP